MPFQKSHVQVTWPLKSLSLLFASLFLFALPPASANTQLAAAPFATYVSDDGEPARLTMIVQSAFERAKQDVDLHVMRDAFLGSAVLTGKVDGEFAFIDLGEDKSDFLLSDIYLPVYLYAVGKTSEVESIRLFPHLKNNRVAIENRFANTPTFRLLKEVKWSRNPSAFDAFKQLADDRAPYLVTTALLASEFNKLLSKDNEELLHFSSKPLVKTGFQLAVRKDVKNAKQLIDAFNIAINEMQMQGDLNTLLSKPWLTKDIDGDGVADYIGHTSTTSKSDALNGFYPLDNTLVSDSSRYYINGKQYTALEEARKVLEVGTEIQSAHSLLDATIYEQLIRRW